MSRVGGHRVSNKWGTRGRERVIRNREVQFSEAREMVSAARCSEQLRSPFPLQCRGAKLTHPSHACENIPTCAKRVRNHAIATFFRPRRERKPLRRNSETCFHIVTGSQKFFSRHCPSSRPLHVARPCRRAVSLQPLRSTLGQPPILRNHTAAPSTQAMRQRAQMRPRPTPLIAVLPCRARTIVMIPAELACQRIAATRSRRWNRLPSVFRSIGAQAPAGAISGVFVDATKVIPRSVACKRPPATVRPKTAPPIARLERWLECTICRAGAPVFAVSARALPWFLPHPSRPVAQRNCDSTCSLVTSVRSGLLTRMKHAEHRTPQSYPFRPRCSIGNYPSLP